jgi:PhnB protein
VAEVIPYLLYGDVAAMLEWLGAAFGFVETERQDDPTGSRVAHAEMELDGGRIMLGDPGDDYRNPRHVGTLTQLLYVYIDDVDAHYERARAAGAEIRDEPADQSYGDRTYSALDPEGHHWYFAQRPAG